MSSLKSKCNNKISFVTDENGIEISNKKIIANTIFYLGEQNLT